MRAMVLERLGEPLKLVERPVPQPKVTTIEIKSAAKKKNTPKTIDIDPARNT